MKYIKYIGVFLSLLLICTFNVKASSKTTYVDLTNLKYSTNDSDYSSIKTYKSLEDFIKDYNDSNLPSIYITNFLFDGVSSVVSPDLDDFIESDSNDTKIKTLSIKVLNINTLGDIELTGEFIGMVGVDTNNREGEINLILNNVNINTDSKKAPAIYVYNKDINYTKCKVTIKTLANTTNYIEGGKLKKVSLIGSDELAKYGNYYNNESLTNYNKYTNYYGIYTSDEIDNILFAKVEADREDLTDGDPYYFYKASGALSSDIDLYFEGEGYLKVTSKNKEGIETKGNLEFVGGTGDYEVFSYDDALNTTTSSRNARNDITINVNSLLAYVLEDADEGDAIDSNGSLTINGGTIYAFAHPTSGDAGLDSNNGTIINGGVVIAIGNMMDGISSESSQNYIYTNLNGKIDADTLVVIKDELDNIIAAFKANRTFKTILYSSPDLNTKTYKVYIGGTIDGEETNGLYTKINSYTNGEEASVSNTNNMVRNNSVNNNKNNTILYILLSQIFLLVAFIIGVYLLYIKPKKINYNT